MNAFWYRLGQRFFRLLIRPYWPTRLQGLQNLPRHGAVLLAGNHPTVLDGGLLGVFCPRRVRFLIDARVLRIPILGHFLRSLGSIPVERGGHSLDQARKALLRGSCLGIYPEAAPTGSLRLGRFKKGVAVLARDVPGLAVVPVAVVGTQPLCSHHHLYAQPGPVVLRFGPALHWCEGESLDSFLGRLRAALEALAVEPAGRFRLTLAALLSGLLLAPPSAVLLALSRRRFSPLSEVVMN